MLGYILKFLGQTMLKNEFLSFAWTWSELEVISRMQ